MSFFRSTSRALALGIVLALTIASPLMQRTSFAQETTGGLQGTVKDANGAVVPKAHVELTGTALAGAKALQTDAGGYYRFANLPPGVYSVTVKVEGFATLKRDGITIEIGHLPSLDLALKVGSASTVVEVTAEAPLIDVTVSHTSTNVTEDVIADVPHGRSFQSVIQFAPSARNEPLAGSSGGTGGSMPGSSGNGLGFGYSVAGAADSENSYLVEGQDTENISGGFSKANVPFEFIQEVQVKSSGIEAEHGGALGGVVNVVMKKGSNAWHGQIFSTYQSSAMDGNPNQYLRYDPTSNGAINRDPSTNALTNRFDQSAQLYQPKKDNYHYTQPGFTIGGPIWKDKVWFFAGFAPQLNSDHRVVDFGANDNNAGKQFFNQDEKLYYGVARIDATLTQKVRVFASWLTQGSREVGANMPWADSKQGYVNEYITTPLTDYAHALGWTAPNQTMNFGADVTLTPRIVSTTRFGYFFENYRDFGWPTTGANLYWATPGVDGSGNPYTDALGNPLPTGLQQPQGTQTASAYDGTYTLFNANKHYQFDEDIAMFKSGWKGTHNFKFGYQLNHLANNINQNGNVPYVIMVPGAYPYSPNTSFGGANCTSLTATYGQCQGQYGYLEVQDFSTIGKASDYNHGFFVQDAWTIGKGVTINAGIRIEKENVPAPAGTNLAGHTVNFGWGDKIAPRLGAAWDVFQNGKTKVFGSYGVTNDIMKLLMAMTSWGGQAYEDCVYGIGPNAAGGFDPNAINATFVNSRACPSAAANVGANWGGGAVPSGLSLIENMNWRPYEPVAPNVKPYRQHETAFGVDYQIAKNWAFEARWDRRRLDHILEDASLADVNWGETYAIVNPGEGVNKTIDGFSSYLGSLGQSFGVPGWSFDPASFGTCASCPNNPKAVRNYDGLEFRLTKSNSKHWSGMFSYTYSALRGNYTGLTTTDQNDGGSPGRNSPDTTRSFDEPWFYFTSGGKSANGPLPTDRPNTFKGYVYYQLAEGKRNTTTFGIFQTAYQGSPVSTYMDVGGGGNVVYAPYVFGHGNWANVASDSLGNLTITSISERRTPWFSQSDLNIGHELKVSRSHEQQVLGFEANITNLFDQRAITSYYQGLNSASLRTPLMPGPGNNVYGGAAAYHTFETGYSVQNYLNSQSNPVVLSSWYGQPYSYQLGRTIRLKVRFTF
jgi:hypothetical protein